MQRRFRKMKCVIDFNKEYNPLSLEYQTMLASEEYLKQSLAKMPEKTFSDLVKKARFVYEWKRHREFMYGGKILDNRKSKQ